MTKRKTKAEAALDDNLARILPAGILMSQQPDGTARCMIDPKASPDSFRSLGGSDRITANLHLVNEVLAILPTSPDVWTLACRVAGTLALLQEMAPADGIEGMIAVQAVALHVMSMETARRVLLPGQDAGVVDKLRKSSANLMRAQTDMLAALDRKRGKVNHQTVRVERVLVTEGGALIGASVAAIGQGPALMTMPAVKAREGVGA